MVNGIEDEKNRLPLDEDVIALLKSPPYLAVEENGSASEIHNAPDVFHYTHVHPKKRHYVEHACIVCDISDSCVVPCSANGCPIALHRTCADFGSEDPSMSYCPYCWFKYQATRYIPLRTMVVAAAKALVLYGRSKADVFMAKESIHLQDSSQKSLPMHLHENLDIIREVLEQVKAHNSQLEVDMDKAQQNTCGEGPLVINDQPKRIIWTAKEEDMLRVGVETFSAKINKNMPWNKILEMGKGVFHKTRNTSGISKSFRALDDTCNSRLRKVVCDF